MAIKDDSVPDLSDVGFVFSPTGMSEAGSSVPGMYRDDVVEPVDAALQELLALIAEHTDDPVKSDVIRDFLLTCPPVDDWSAGSQQRLAATCRYVMALARSLSGV